MVERHVANVNVVGSNPISRSTLMAGRGFDRHVKRTLFILIALLGTSLSAAYAQKDLTSDQTEAYKAVIKAEIARDSGAVADARRLYQQALDLYSSIAKNDPAWHPEIVQFRIADCRSQLEALKGSVEGDRPNSNATPQQLDISLAEAQQRIAQLEVENESLRAESEKSRETQVALEADMEAVQKARLEAPELNAARDEVRNLLDQLTALSNQYIAIELQYQAATSQLVSAQNLGDDLEKQLKQTQGDASEVDKLRAERDRLKSDLKSARADAKKKGGDAADSAEWEQAKAALEAELSESRATQEKLTAQLAAATERANGLAATSADDTLPKLQADLEQARNALTETGRKIADLRATALDLLAPQSGSSR